MFFKQAHGFSFFFCFMDYVKQCIYKILLIFVTIQKQTHINKSKSSSFIIQRPAQV